MENKGNDNFLKKHAKITIPILLTVIVCIYVFLKTRTTKGNFNAITQILECLYYIVGVFAFAALVNGSRQNKLLSEEISNSKQVAEDTFKRETASLTVQRCKEYADEIIPRINKMSELLKVDGKNRYTRRLEVEDFNNKENYKEFVKNKVYDNNEISSYCTESANSLEAFSMYFTQEICDCEIAYSAIAETFILVVNYLYPSILKYRILFKSNGYSNIVKLYEIWISKFNSEKIAGVESELENLQEGLNKKKRDLEEEKKRYGCEEDLIPIGLKKSKSRI